MVSEIILNNIHINTMNIVIDIYNMNTANMNIIYINNAYLLLRPSPCMTVLQYVETLPEFSLVPFTIEYKLYLYERG